VTAAAPREYLVEAVRHYDAPRRRVFECWTRAEHLAHWFGPAGFSIHSCEAEPRPGGRFSLCLRSPEGRDYWVRGAYLEVDAPGRIVIRCFADDARGVQRLDELITVQLAEEDGGTRLTLRASAAGAGPEAAAMLDGMEQGWRETLDRLGARAAAPSDKGFAS
jgi:uncharacterized protein YndB with AHSA1/START domain